MALQIERLAVSRIHATEITMLYRVHMSFVSNTNVLFVPNKKEKIMLIAPDTTNGITTDHAKAIRI